MDQVCLEHSGHQSRLENLEEGERSLLTNINAAHRRIDGMKNWVIAGMTSLIMQLVLAIIGLALYWVRSAPGG